MLFCKNIRYKWLFWTFFYDFFFKIGIDRDKLFLYCDIWLEWCIFGGGRFYFKEESGIFFMFVNKYIYIIKK